MSTPDKESPALLSGAGDNFTITQNQDKETPNDQSNIDPTRR